MNGRRLFVDTAFVQALSSRGDQFHERALRWFPILRGASEAWITEPILVEIGNALSGSNRKAALDFIRRAYRTTNMRVVTADTALVARALQLYEDRADKTWGLTDCISFVVMWEQGLTEALTADRHFEQAGFMALLLRDPP